MSAPDIAAVNLQTRIALLTTDVPVPVTDMFDADGEATDEIDQCVVFVCGSDATGWFTVNAAAFDWHALQ